MKVFIPEYDVDVGQVDAFLKMPRPCDGYWTDEESEKDDLGLTQVDEPNINNNGEDLE